MAAELQYPMWTVHLPKPPGAKPLRCITDPQGPGRASSYDDTGGSASHGGTIHTSFENGAQVDSNIVWSGYKYRITQVSYGPPSVAYNHLGDIPGCSPDSDSPDVPMPHGSIDIVATNTGKLATTDESQVNITTATQTIRISIPVYRQTDVAKRLTGSNQEYVPLHIPELTTEHVALIRGLSRGKTGPPQLQEILTSTTQYVYYRDPVIGSVFAPTKGLVIASGTTPPGFSKSRGDKTQSVIMRSTMSDNKSLLILPNNGGTARAMSITNQPFKTQAPGTKESISPTQGIPVVVKDKNGKSVRVVATSSTTDTNPAHMPARVMVSLKQVMAFIVVALSIFGTFVGLPLGSVHEDSSPYVSSVLSIGVAFVFALTLSGTSSVIGSSRVVDSSLSPVASTLIFGELLVTLVALIVVMVTSTFRDGDVGDWISISIYILIFAMAVMILTIGPYVARSSKSTYNATYQSYPMYYDRILTILKYTLPLAIVIMSSSPIQHIFTSLFTKTPRGGTGLNPILNMVYNAENLYTTDVSVKPKPFPGTDTSLLTSLMWFYDDSKTPMAPVDFAQHPVGHVQSALTRVKGATTGEGNLSDVVAAVNHRGKTLVVNAQAKPPSLIETDTNNRVPQSVNPKHLLRKGDSLLKEGYGIRWHIGISLALMVFFAAALMIPAFTGGIAFKTDERVAEEPREKPTIAEVVLDSMYGFGVPILVLASILYTFWGSGNTTQMILLSLGPVIAMVVNGVAFSYRK